MTEIEKIMTQKRQLAEALELAPNESCGRTLLDLRLLLYLKQGGEDPRPGVMEIDPNGKSDEVAQLQTPQPPEESEPRQGYVEWRKFPYAKGFFLGTTGSDPKEELVPGLAYFSGWVVPPTFNSKPNATPEEMKEMIRKAVSFHSDNLLFFSDKQATIWTWVPALERPDWIVFINRG